MRQWAPDRAQAGMRMLRQVLSRGIRAADRLSGGAVAGAIAPWLPSVLPAGPVKVRLGGVEGEVPPGTTILQACRQLGVDLEHCCGGEATCGTCRVVIRDGGRRLSRIEPKEGGALQAFQETPDDRLGCQARIYGPVTVEIPEDWRAL